MLDALVPAATAKKSPGCGHVFGGEERVQPRPDTTPPMFRSGNTNGPFFIDGQPFKKAMAKSMRHLPLATCRWSLHGMQVFRVMNADGNGIKRSPDWREFVTIDKQASVASMANENPEAPQSQMESVFVKAITGRSPTALSGLSKSFEAPHEQEVAHRRTNISPPAPQLLSHQLLGESADTSRILPASKRLALSANCCCEFASHYYHSRSSLIELSNQ